MGLINIPLAMLHIIIYAECMNLHFTMDKCAAQRFGQSMRCAAAPLLPSDLSRFAHAG